MIAILTLLIVLTLSLLLARVATAALTHTGLSEDSSRFQAWSALSGVGYTTAESENVVNHPVRRKILMVLMLLGNAGIVTLVSSLILAFMSQEQDGTNILRKISLLIAGLCVLWYLSSSKWVHNHLARLIDKALTRYTDLPVVDYESLLELAGDYRVTEIHINTNDWLAGKSLRSSRLRQEGLNLLGIRRADGTYEGTPKPDALLCAGDSILVYGQLASIEGVNHRRGGNLGDIDHEYAIAAQEKEMRKG
ncbi:MAG: TrkA C-terminal domain-containing protein [Planctomycetes bacterium]|nr:TrkA C-terminal domain-containing protein [Planctomycetota bacterium]